jgi:hypothetical protein
MLHTPNVTSITIDGYCPCWSPSDAHEEQPWDWWEAAIPRRDNFFTLKSPQPFSRLKEIRMYEAITMVQLASVMRLPALEKLMIWHLTDGTTSLSEATPDQWSPAMFPQGSTRIRFLELSGEPVHEDVLSTLIDACQKLEIFSYSQCSNQGGMYTEKTRGPISLAKVIKSLYEHRSTLHSLALYYTGYATYIDGLSGFTKLERLCIDACLLSINSNAPAESLRNMLPSSIRRLRLEGTLPCLFTDPSHSLCGSQGVDVAHLVLPRLEYLGLNLNEDWEKETDVFLERWCRKAMLKFLSDDYPFVEVNGWNF